MSDVVDKVLGVTGGVSAVIAFIFYKCYKNRDEFSKQIKKVQVFQPDNHLYAKLDEPDEGLWAYAAVEGLVTDLGRSLTSQHVPAQGVVKRTRLVEHRSRRTNGFWAESKKDLRDNTQSVPFALLGLDKDSSQRVEIVDPLSASHLQEEMDLTYDRFEPHKSSLMEIGLDRLFGEVTKGVQETETMLLNGTSVLALGRVFLERGKAKLGPPVDESKHPFIITKLSLGELIRSYESQSRIYKVLSAMSALLGSGLILWLIWRQWKVWAQKRRERQQFEVIRSALRSQQSVSETTRSRGGGGTSGPEEGDGEDAAASGSERREENCCVVCLTNARQVIALPCGHVATCLNCAEVLPSPKKCPICRADVERFMQAFYA